MAKLKRTAFWIEAGVSLISIFLVASTLVIMFVESMLSGGFGEFLQRVGHAGGYFLRMLVEFVSEGLLTSLAIMALVAVYVSTMIYFAQSPMQKRICKYAIPLAIVCFPICVVAFLLMVFGVFVSSP